MQCDCNLLSNETIYKWINNKQWHYCRANDLCVYMCVCVLAWVQGLFHQFLVLIFVSVICIIHNIHGAMVFAKPLKNTVMTEIKRRKGCSLLFYNQWHPWYVEFAESQCIWWVEWAKVCGESKWGSRVVWGIPGDTDVTSSQANWPKRIISKLRRVLVLLSRVFKIRDWSSISFHLQCLPPLSHVGLITLLVPVVRYI